MYNSMDKKGDYILIRGEFISRRLLKFHLYEILEIAKLYDRKQISGCQRPKGQSRVLNTKEHKRTFWHNGKYALHIMIAVLVT